MPRKRSSESIAPARTPLVGLIARTPTEILESELPISLVAPYPHCGGDGNVLRWRAVVGRTNWRGDRRVTKERSKLEDALIVLAYKMGQDAYRLRLIDNESNLERVASELA